jgi:hypothetical protein
MLIPRAESAVVVMASVMVTAQTYTEQRGESVAEIPTRSFGEGISCLKAQQCV